MDLLILLRSDLVSVDSSRPVTAAGRQGRQTDGQEDNERQEKWV